MSVEKEIMLFLEQKTQNAALMLSGDWGCGKTYLVHQLQEKLNKGSEYMVVTVSLFGLNTVDAVHRKVKEKTMAVFAANTDLSASDEHTIDYSKNILNTVLKTVAIDPKFTRAANSIMSVNVYDLIDLRRNLHCFRDGRIQELALTLVFDDFERCTINKFDLLGAISEYSLNRKIRTIIVTDENKITDKAYYEMKEKLISQVVHLVPDYEAVIASILSSYQENAPGYTAFLTNNAAVITQVFMESGTGNFRNYVAVVNAFERVYRIWTESGVPENRMLDVFYLFAADLIEMRNNNFCYSEEHGSHFIDKNTYSKYRSFSKYSKLHTLSKWVADGVWNEDELREEIMFKFSNESVSDDTVLIYGEPWNLSDEQIKRAVPKLTQRAQNGELNGEDIINLLNRLVLFRDYGITVPEGLDDELIQTALNRREKKLVDGEAIEPHAVSRIGEDMLAKMSERENEMYLHAVRLNSRFRALKRRSEVITSLLEGTEKGLRSMRSSLVSLDDYFCKLCFKSYLEMDNAHKRTLMVMLSEANFTDDDVSNAADRRETYENLLELKNNIKSILWTEKDSVARYIHNQTIAAVDKKLLELNIDA